MSLRPASARLRRRSLLGLALAASLWPLLSAPVLSGHAGPLALTHTSLLALACGALPVLLDLARAVDRPLAASRRNVAALAAMNAGCGALAACVVLATQLARSFHPGAFTGWMGEDLGAVAAIVIFTVGTLFTGLGALVLLLADLAPARRASRELGPPALLLLATSLALAAAVA